MIKVWIVAVTALFFLSGCGTVAQKENEQNLKSSAYTSSDFEHVQGIRIYMSRRSYSEKLKDLTLIIENNTDQVITFGMDYTFEIKRKGGWYVLPFRKDAAFIEMAQQLNAHEKIRGKISMDLLNDQPKKGEYRVIKKIGAQVFAASFNLE